MGAPVVELVVGGPYRDQVEVELAPPDLDEEMLLALVRRMAVMAHLPYHHKDECAEGPMVITRGGDRVSRFMVRVEGQGPTLSAMIRVLD
jgi:hypothetical protein